MRSKFNLKNLSVICSILAVQLLITSCNEGGGATVLHGVSAQSPLESKLQKLDATVNMDVEWNVDGGVKDIALNSALKDTGWHIATMKVKRIDKDTKPTPVNGLLYAIYPKPTQNLGQDLELKDINCKTAIFAKEGDSCSTYFRLKYDPSKYKSGRVIVPVQIVPSGDISSMLSFSAPIDPDVSVANYRFINSAESYYNIPKIASNKSVYQILLVQNSNGKFPISLTTLQTPTNPKFTIVHRTTNDNNDPYYGSNSECSLNPNPNLKQVKDLPNQDDNCIVVYQVASTSTQAIERDNLQISCNALYFFPTWANKFIFQGSYTKIPDLLPYNITSLVNSVTEPQPFSHYDFSMSIRANKISDVIQSEKNTSRLLVPDGIDYSNKEIFSVDATRNNAIERGSITGASQKYPEGLQLANGSTQVTACGGAAANSNAQVYSFKSLTQQNLVRIHIQSNSNGDCGNWVNGTLDLNVPMSGFNQEIYHVNAGGCGGKNWDIGGFVSINGGCNTEKCSYQVAVTATHGGVGSQCHDRQTSTYNLEFNRPDTNLYLYTSGLNNYPTQIYYGGTRFNLGMGASGNICNSTNYKSLTYDAGTFNIKASCDGNPSTALNYAIGMGTGQQFYNGSISFLSSSGYNLTKFTIESE